MVVVAADALAVPDDMSITEVVMELIIIMLLLLLLLALDFMSMVEEEDAGIPGIVLLGIGIGSLRGAGLVVAGVVVAPMPMPMPFIWPAAAATRARTGRMRTMVVGWDFLFSVFFFRGCRDGIGSGWEGP